MTVMPPVMTKHIWDPCIMGLERGLRCVVRVKSQKGKGKGAWRQLCPGQTTEGERVPSPGALAKASNGELVELQTKLEGEGS